MDYENPAAQNSRAGSREPQSILFIPLAIIVGMGLIAAALYFSRTATLTDGSSMTGNTVASSTTQIPPVTAQDHILGNPNAPIMMVEYTDLDCPYCQQFQTTMHQIMNDYGAGGKVAWVVRNLPFQQLHPNAPGLALDAECVASLGGNDAYWKFIDLIFSRADGTETDLASIPGYVQQVGVDQSKFQMCVDSKLRSAVVEQEYSDAMAAGAQGTPYTVIMVGNQHFAIAGARPYSTVQKVLDTILTQLNSAEGQPVSTSSMIISQ